MPFGREDRLEHAERFLEAVVHDNVIEIVRRLQLVERGPQPRRALVVRLTRAAGEPPEQLGTGGRQDEDEHRSRQLLPHLSRALHIDIEHDGAALLERRPDAAQRRAVATAVDPCPLEQLATLLHRLEPGVIHEVVVDAVPLVVARRARGRGHRKDDVLVALDERARQRRLASAAGGGEHERECVLPALHSTFSTCSRSRSISSLIAITRCSIAASFALAPIVFVSRCISWIRKLSRFPTGSDASAATVSRNSARCDRSRTSSSLMSQRSAMSAISRATRSSSIGCPSSSSVTTRRIRSRSATSLAGAASSMLRMATSIATSLSSRSAARRCPSSSRMRTVASAAASVTSRTSSGSTSIPSLSSSRTIRSWKRERRRMSISPLRPSTDCSVRSASTYWRARSRSTCTPVPAGSPFASMRSEKLTWPRGRRERSHSRTCPSYRSTGLASRRFTLKKR